MWIVYLEEVGTFFNPKQRERWVQTYPGTGIHQEGYNSAYGDLRFADRDGRVRSVSRAILRAVWPDDCPLVPREARTGEPENVLFSPGREPRESGGGR